MKNLVIAVDGPAGAGKSTIAKIIADKLNINYIDTGAMYRAVTYKVLQNNIDTTDEQAIIEVAKASEIDFKDNNIYLDGKILKEEIRTPEVSNNVSNVAQIKEVRYLMVDVQREIGNRSSVILDGRDIGSYVFPNADYKFFLNASLKLNFSWLIIPKIFLAKLFLFDTSTFSVILANNGFLSPSAVSILNTVLLGLLDIFSSASSNNS